MRKPYLKKLLISGSQLLCVLLLNGHEDQTFSGEIGRRAELTGKRRYLLIERIINAVFFWDTNHCRNSIERGEV